MIKVRALGAAEVQIGRRRITMKTELLLVLAVYLAMRAGERVTRDEVVELFWPGADPAKGRHSLRQMLYKLRQRGFELDEDGEVLYLDPARVDCDATAILDARSLSHADPTAQAHAPLLDGLRRRYPNRLSEWRDRMGGRVNAAILHRALRQLNDARRQGRWQPLLELANQVLAMDPLNEEATLAKAEAIAMHGSKALAIDVLDEYAQELGTKAGTLSLPLSVLRRRISEQQRTWHLGASPEQPLVGREGIIGRLSDALEVGATGAGRVVLLIGPAGVGKSAILRETSQLAALRGFATLAARADTLAALRPVSFAAQIASSTMALRGAAGASPDAVSILRRVVKGDVQPEPTAGSSSAGIAVADLSWALSDALAAASCEQRLLLVLDDCHNIDDLSWEALARVAAALSESRVVLVLASRRVRPDTDAHLLHAATTEIIRVPPLSAGASLLVASQTASRNGRPLSADAAARIVNRAGGNPLFIRELVAAEQAHDLAASLPQSLTEIIESRLAALGAGETKTLRAVCLLGRFASAMLVSKLQRSNDVPFSEIVEHLESEDVLSLDNSGQLFIHECWADRVIALTPPATRAALAMECAEALLASATESESHEQLWHSADLFCSAGCSSKAALLYLRVGESLIARGLASQAAAAFSAAAGVASVHGRARVLERLSAAHALSCDYASAAAAAQDGLASLHATTPDHAALRVLLLATLADSLWREHAQHADVLSQLATAVSSAGVPDNVRQLGCLVGMRIVHIAQDSPLKDDFRRVVIESAERTRATPEGALALLIHAAERGDADDVFAVDRLLAGLCAEDPPPHLRSVTLRYRAAAMRMIGECRKAMCLGEAAMTSAIASGLPREAHHAAALLTFLHLDEGDAAKAADWLERMRETSSDPSNDAESRQIQHATARLFLLAGQPRECLRVAVGHIEQARADMLPRRRGADCSCIALAAALAGEIGLADEMLSVALVSLRGDSPSHQLDYIADSSIKALSALGRHAEAESIRLAYLARRARESPRRIPAGLTALHLCGETPQADVLERSAS